MTAVYNTKTPINLSPPRLTACPPSQLHLSSCVLWHLISIECISDKSVIFSFSFLFSFYYYYWAGWCELFRPTHTFRGPPINHFLPPPLCYTSCTLTALHCSKVSFLQCCHMKRYNKIFTKMWGVYSLLWDTVYTGAGHIIRISSKSWFISLIPFKKWNLYNVYIHSTQTDIFQVFISFNFDDYKWQLMKTPNSVSQKIRILWKGSILRHLVPHSNQIINSKHLQRPLNGLSV